MGLICSRKGKKKDKKTSNDTVCAICLDRMNKGSNHCTLIPCHHTFHSKCASTWIVIYSKYTCPICRGLIDHLVGNGFKNKPIGTGSGINGGTLVMTDRRRSRRQWSSYSLGSDYDLIDTSGSIDTIGSIDTSALFRAIRERNLNGHFGNSQVGVTNSQVGVTNSPLRETNVMDLDLYPERPATA